MTTPELEVLIPTRNRPVELATTLSGLAAQDFPDFAVVVSDQSDGAASYDTPAALTMARMLRHRGHRVRFGTHRPPLGIAEQRNHLLSQSRARFVLFLDDDVWLEPGTLQRMHTAITELKCGFVGCAVQGLSYLDDHRPRELEPFEIWPGAPEPEQIRREDKAWQRWTLHNAANPTHLAEQLGLRDGHWVAYKVAWVGGCVLYDREKLKATGGFEFWRKLPRHHCGEDVLAQLRVMARYGGAGILPSGAVHLEAPTTVARREVEAYDVVPPDFWRSGQ
ncbi:glycosyltransferase [Nocardia transvalensis]|uniref:glycosyltransferase n=1 Tax=Nocardia transvalensis TaxID=37333 RepID=UPI001893F0F8|nr:glycosyltransferase family 2 protein [Nocardia transvalensis]MBF6327823.1 glycosyltransferase [Nocardia transvalensis]